MSVGLSGIIPLAAAENREDLRWGDEALRGTWKPIIVDGRVEHVDGTRDPASYDVTNRGTLNVYGEAVIDRIVATNSQVLIDNAVVRDGIQMIDGQATIKNAHIFSESSYGVMAGSASNPGQEFLIGSNVKLVDSVVSGIGTASVVGPNGEMSISNSELFGKERSGRGDGVAVSGGTLRISDRSFIEGENHGVLLVENRSGVPESVELSHKLVVHNSTLKGQTGAAIRVNTKTELAEIYVADRSVLLSQNGKLLDVTGAGKTLFKVDNSDLVGDLVADSSSTLDITLQDRAHLTGDIVNSNTLAINSGAQWQMTGDHVVKSLSMDGGIVRFREAGLHMLSLDQLSGNGTFAMHVDLDSGIGDLLDVNGWAEGRFGLRVRNTGVEVVSPDMQPLRIVHTEGGSAQFSLIGGRVDLGTYSYLLEQQGNDWFIVGNGKTTSPSTNTALALYNAAPSIWQSEMSTLRARMGEVRNGGTNGAWMRAYGNRLDATTSDGVSYRHNLSGLSLGVDAPLDVRNGQVLLGLLGGYSKSDLDMSHGTKGKVNSYYVGAYGTWLSDDGYYLDGVLKLNRFRNKADVAMSDATKAKGDYANASIGGSVEFGRRIKLADDYFLEPFAQLSAVAIEGGDYRLDNGLEAKGLRTHSVLGKVGTSVGRNIALKDGGVLQPYLRVAAAQEFARNNHVKVNDAKFDNSLFGSRAELGGGVTVSLSDRIQVHADLDYMKGKRVEQPWGANLGVRFAF